MRAEGVPYEFEDRNGHFYSGEDLNFLQSIYEEVLAEALGDGAARADEAALRLRIAAAIFATAEAGERDPAALAHAARQAAQTEA
jgi:hypothetical protein